MTTIPSPPAASDPGSGADDSTKEQAKQTAATAAHETQHVAGVASEEARKVAGEAKEHARGLLDEALAQATDQSRTQLGRAADTLHSFSNDLDDMASSDSASGLAQDLAREVAARARDLGSHLDGREPSELFGDLRSFAGRRPGLFLAGALVAGVAAGRLARGAQAAKDEDKPSASGAPAGGLSTAADTTPAYGATGGISSTPMYDATGSGASTPAVATTPAFLDDHLPGQHPSTTGDLP